MQIVARESGKLRVLLSDSSWAKPRIVPARDTLLAPTGTSAAELSRSALTLPQTTTLKEALEQMRTQNEQLAVVVPTDGDSDVLGMVTWDYMLDQLWPSIERELDRAQSHRES